MILKVLKNKKDLYKVGSFVFVNYLMAIPFFFYMIQTLDWNNFYLPYLAALLVFFIFVLLFILIFPNIVGTFKKLLFSFLWVLSSSVFLETFVLFLNNAKAQDTMITIGGDYSVFMPVWLVISLIEFVGGILLLKKPTITLLKYEFAFKFIINFWGLCAVALLVGTSDFLIRALLPILISGWLLTYFLSLLKTRIISKYLNLTYGFICVNIFANILALFISAFLNTLGTGSLIINILYSFFMFMIFFLPITLLILVVNYKI